jgi:hypothetical protein
MLMRPSGSFFGPWPHPCTVGRSAHTAPLDTALIIAPATDRTRAFLRLGGCFSVGEHGRFRRLIEPQRGFEARLGDPSYFELTRKARISRSVSDSFDRNMWCAPVSLTTRAVGTPASSALACLSVEALIAV